MNNPSTIQATEGSQGKRLACDRCRTQKLKCTRSTRSDTCQRCISAKAPCIFGNSRPPGRPPAAGARSGRGFVDNRLPDTTPFRQNELAIPTLPLAAQSSLSEDHNAQTQTVRSPNPSSSETARPQMNSIATSDDEHLFNMFYDTAMADLDATTFAISPAPSTQLPAEHPRDTRTPFLSLTDLHPEPFPGDESPLHPHVTLDGRSMNQPPLLTPPLGNSAASRSQRMLHIMQLGALMYELQSDYAEHPVQPLSTNTFPTDFAGKVLHAATTFLRALRSFFPDPARPSSASLSSSIRRRGPSDLPDGDLDDPSWDPYRHSCSSSAASTADWSSTTTTTTRRVAHDTDKPASLQLISCHLRLLQLYLLLHTSIYDYVRSTDAAARRRQPLWRDLSVGAAPLHAFADLQIALVLQAAARLLGDIEGALGLADGCRVTAARKKRAPGEGAGILGRNVTAHFVEMCMAEVMAGVEEGRGAVARLREVMERLGGLLDGPVLF